MKKPNTNTNTNTNTKQRDYLKVSSFSVPRAKILPNGHVAFDLVLNGITLYGCFVVESENGDFISFPQKQGKDGKWYHSAYAWLSEDDTKQIIHAVEVIINEQG